MLLAPNPSSGKRKCPSTTRKISAPFIPSISFDLMPSPLLLCATFKFCSPVIPFPLSALYLLRFYGMPLPSACHFYFVGFLFFSVSLCALLCRALQLPSSASILLLFYRKHPVSATAQKSRSPKCGRATLSFVLTIRHLRFLQFGVCLLLTSLRYSRVRSVPLRTPPRRPPRRGACCGRDPRTSSRKPCPRGGDRSRCPCRPRSSHRA